jgi:hypothetical protein
MKADSVIRPGKAVIEREDIMSGINKIRALSLSAAIAAVVSATPAFAGVITISGGFGQYIGPVGYPPGTPEYNGNGPTLFNGIQVDPTSPSSRPGVGLVTHDFAPGTSSVDFFIDNAGASHNLLQFTPAAPQDVQVGQEFLIGTFTIQNGNWLGGESEGDPLFTFSVITSSNDPTLDGHVFTDTIHYRITQNEATNTPQQNADRFGFEGRADLGDMSVYELLDSPIGSNIATFDLLGVIGSLIPTRFANAQGGGFIDSPADAPEPGTSALLLAGLGGLGIVSRRRARRLRERKAR